MNGVKAIVRMHSGEIRHYELGFAASELDPDELRKVVEDGVPGARTILVRIK